MIDFLLSLYEALSPYEVYATVVMGLFFIAMIYVIILDTRGDREYKEFQENFYKKSITKE